MDPQRWKTIRVAFDALVDLDASERARRLTALGVTDPELREAVAALLSADGDADAWLAPVESTLGVEQGFDSGGGPPGDVDFPARLAHALGSAYRLERELGGGGMSRVFVAEETAFRRKVVVKVLRPDLVEAISTRRFQREIQVAARLQHPHIVPLLNAREEDGILFYTMPFVEGETLRARLRSEREIPIADTVRVMRDVASALAYAHSQGVVHRDIKPENILLSAGGAVVADFGIAKALSASRSQADDQAPPTTVTEHGVALGTPQYMAPEQAIGDSTYDGRADLYALGIVAYEMLAGRPPFEGRSSQQLMAAHATEEPDPVTKRRPNTPLALAVLVMRCIEKRPADRPRDASEVVRALDDAALMAPAPALPTSQERARAMQRAARRFPWVIAGVCTVVAGAGGMMLASWRGTPTEAKPSLFQLMLPDSAAPRIGYGRTIDLSPDGSMIAYIGSSTRSVLVRALDDPLPRRLPGSDGAQCPTFSPDGQWIAFISRGRLQKVALRGGLPIALSDSATVCSIWTDHNEIFFDWNGRLFRISPDGGAISYVAGWDSAQHVGHVIATQALPGGKHALVMLTETMALDFQVGVVSLRDGRVTKLGPKGVGPTYSRGHVLYSRGKEVIATPFSLRALRFSGRAVPLPLRDTIQPGFATTDDGSLAYVAQSEPTLSLVAVNEHGRTRTLAGNPQGAPVSTGSVIPLDTASYFGYPRLSPDGRRVALEMKTGSFAWDVWVYDIGSRTLSRLTSNFTGGRPSGWTADGRSVVFLSGEGSNPNVMGRIATQQWDGSAPHRDLLLLTANTHDFSVSLAKRLAVSTRLYPQRPSDIWITPLDTPQAARVIVPRGKEPRLSSDGELMAYTSDETGNDEVYAQSIQKSAGRLQISAGGGWQPVWGADGRHVYYRSPGYVMRATIQRDRELQVTRRDTLFRDVFEQHNMTDYDVFPSGKELLMIRANSSPVHAAIVLNWPALLRRSAQPARQR